MKYVIYLRVSTEEQSISGLGIESQRKICREYVDRNGGGNFIEFKDEGVSGSLRMEDRNEMFEGIKSLQRGDIFLVARRDRLGRNVYQNIVAERKIVENKGTLISATQDLGDLDPGMRKLMDHMLDAFAEFELYEIGRRTRSALQIKKSQGFRIGRIPYGYKLGNDKKVIADDIEQSILNEMIALSSRGIPTRKIAMKLNVEAKRNRNGSDWSHVSIHKILRNALGHRMAYL